MTAPALELLDIHKRYGAVAALRGASLSVAPGEIHALLGENGAGKSTLSPIRSASTTLLPTSGWTSSGMCAE